MEKLSHRREQKAKKLGGVTAILFQEWSIVSGVFRHKLITSDGWLEMLLKTLVNRGGGVNSSGCRGMTVGTKANSCHRFWGGHVGM